MTHVLYLVRHGIAHEASATTSDAERALTGEGKRRMKEAARALHTLEVAPALILTSPLRRARETAEILHQHGAPGAALKVFQPLDNAHSAEEIVAALPHRTPEIMLVGHQPSMGELASYLLTGSPGLVPLPFKKGAIAAISLHTLPPRTPGTLEWFLTPRQLRAIAP